MKLRFALLGLLALVVSNCATTPRADNYDPDQILVQVQNQTHNRITYYLMYSETSDARVRMLACNGLSTCNFWISTRRSQQLLSQGAIHIGWRIDYDEGRDPFNPRQDLIHGRGSLYSGITGQRAVVLVVATSTLTYIYPGQRSGKVA